MIVGIIGLGLIGGSLAKAYKAAGHKVYAYEKQQDILDFALLNKTIDGQVNEKILGGCDLIFIALYPKAAEEFLNEKGQFIKAGTYVIDCCGTKRRICKTGFKAAKKYGFTFIGGHPMAGIEQSGFKFSKGNLFKGAAMVIVPPIYDDMAFLEKIKELLAPAGFGRLTVTTAEKHDKMIAYTSQLAHVVSNAFIKDPIAKDHKGFSANSYKDLTRVAWLNEEMWTELFIENNDNLLLELDHFLQQLQKYRTALLNQDAAELRELLKEGKLIKEEVDR